MLNKDLMAVGAFLLVLGLVLIVAGPLYAWLEAEQGYYFYNGGESLLEFGAILAPIGAAVLAYGTGDKPSPAS